MAEFTAEQKSAIRKHCGVPDSDAYPDAMFGQRAAVFEVDAWMAQLNETGKAHLLWLVGVMENLFARMVEVSDLAEVQKLGSITLNPDAFQNLQNQYVSWQQRLRAALNPAEGRAGGHAGAGGINGRWCA